jgi:hypothetical protein
MVANPFVSTAISTAPVGATQAGFGVPMGLSYNAAALFGADRIRTYDGVDGLTDDGFAATSPEVLWATAVFGQSKRPPLIAIGRGSLPPTQRYVIGVVAATAGATYEMSVKGEGVTDTDVSITLLADLTLTPTHASDLFTSVAHGMVDGDGPYRLTTSAADLPLNLTIDTDYWITDATADTFKLATSYANAIAGTEVAFDDDGTGTHTLQRDANDVLIAQLKQALNNVVGKNFTAVQTAGAGDTDVLTVTADAAGEWFSLAVADLRLLSNAQTHADPGVATDLTAIQAAPTGWYALHTFFNSKAYVVAAAGWVESNGNGQLRRIYHADTCDSLALTQSVGAGGNDTADGINTLDYARTSVWYHPDPSAMFAGRFAGRVLPVLPGGVQAAHKALAGIAAVELTSTWYTNLVAKNANSYSSFESGTADTFLGKTGAGEWWDVVRNDDYVNDAIRVAKYNVLHQNDVVPMDDGGIALMEGALRGALEDARVRRIYTDIVIAAPLASAISTANRTARRLPIPWSATRVGAVVFVTATGTVS